VTCSLDEWLFSTEPGLQAGSFFIYLLCMSELSGSFLLLNFQNVC